MDTEQTPIDETNPAEEAQVDGYYGDDDSDEELDLSFLDEDDDDEKTDEKADVKK